MLSEIGKRYYFPKGIISQSAEAKAKAHKFNATIGIALEHGAPMYLPAVKDLLPDLSAEEAFTYAPVLGKPPLREIWREKQLAENPLLVGNKVSMPIVTSALTHGLSLVSEMFVDPDDILVLPDQLWGNYRLTFEVRQQGKIETYPFFNAGGFNLEGFKETLWKLSSRADKLIVVLNFPNNPTGYTPTVAEAKEIAKLLTELADSTRIVALCDDAYFNLIYDDACFQESIFGLLANAHSNLLAVRLDGATKEQFAWGFRVGFITYGVGGDGDHESIYQALEKKTGGLIRGGVSNAPHPSQSLLLKAMQNPEIGAQQQEKRDILRARALRVHEVLKDPKFADAFEPYPFNSGYFMCLELKNVDAEPLRVHLLDEYGLGTIATAKRDLRVAFSCLEIETLEEVYDTIYKGVCDLQG
jgi:aspartate/methionine/tyrosine aminotransferase